MDTNDSTWLCVAQGFCTRGQSGAVRTAIRRLNSIPGRRPFVRGKQSSYKSIVFVASLTPCDRSDDGNIHKQFATPTLHLRQLRQKFRQQPSTTHQLHSSQLSRLFLPLGHPLTLDANPANILQTPSTHTTTRMVQLFRWRRALTRH